MSPSMPGAVLVKGGTVIDAEGSGRADVGVRDGVVAEVGDKLTAPAGATVLDADGAIVSPGFVDLHTHLREPGGEDAETIETGARAGALGGYTALVARPNTNPPIDSAAGGGPGAAPLGRPPPPPAAPAPPH